MITASESNNGNEEGRNNGNFSDNRGFDGASVLQIRLDTRSVIRDIEMYLRGYRNEFYYDSKERTYKERLAWKGSPMLSEEGIQAVMSVVTSVFNNQVVQGNFLDFDMYAEFLCRTRKELAFILMLHKSEYQLEKYEDVVVVLMRYIEVFMTRPLFNKERESYAQTLQSKEIMSLTNTPQRKGIGGFIKSIF